DAQGFVTARVADVWQHDATQKALNMMKGQAGGIDPIAEVQNATGLTPSDVERVSLVFQHLDTSNPDRTTAWIIVLTANPYDPNPTPGKLTNAKEAKHEGKTYPLGQPPFGPAARPGMPAPPRKDLAIYLAGPRVLVYSDDAGMKNCLSAQ